MPDCRLPTLLAIFVFTLGLTAQAQPPQPASPALRIDPLMIAQATEIWSVIAQSDNPVWPGWNASDTPLLFYLPDLQDVLINHPKPPDGFRRYTGPVIFPGAQIHVRDGKTFFDLDGQNTAREVAGTLTLVVADTLSNRRSNVRGWLEDPRPGAVKSAELSFDQLQGNPYDAMCMIAHEAFHVFQGRQAPKKARGEAALMRYPTIAVQNTVGFALEGEILAEALRNGKPEEMRAHAVRWLAVRRERRKNLTADDKAYEDQIEYLEGLAKYVEYRLMEVMEGRTPQPAMAWLQGFHGYADLKPQREKLIRMLEKMMRGDVNINNDPYGASPLRMRLYYSGMGIAVLLDRLGSNWKKQIFAPAASLTDLVTDAVKPTDAELDAALTTVKARPGYADLIARKTKLEKEGDEATQKLVKEIEAGPRSALVVDYSALGDVKPGLSFTPFGILRVDDNRTIYRLVPITAQMGICTLRQTVPTPMIHDRATKRFTCQLQELVPASKLETLFGHKAAQGEQIELKDIMLPGMKVQGGNATVKIKDNVVELRLTPARP